MYASYEVVRQEDMDGMKWCIRKVNVLLRHPDFPGERPYPVFAKFKEKGIAEKCAHYLSNEDRY